jgi:hypothetical protein
LFGSQPSSILEGLEKARAEVDSGHHEDEEDELSEAF